MKLNWGHKLLFFSILFMVLILGFVFVMMKQSVELVEQDYYEKGIKYQQEIDWKKNSEKVLDVKLAKNTSNQNELSFTILDSSSSINGDIIFYRPSDKSKDFIIPLIVKQAKPVSYPVEGLDKGAWKIKVHWKDQSGDHLITKDLMLE